MFELIVRNSFGVKLYFLLNNLLKYDRLSKPTSKEISIIALFVEVNKIDDFSSLKLLIYCIQVRPICFLKKRIK